MSRSQVRWGADFPAWHITASLSRTADGTPVALVVPGASLLTEDAVDAFAVQVRPLIRRSVETDGKMLHTFWIHFLHQVLHGGFRIFELDGRQAAACSGAVFLLPSRLHYLFQEAVDVPGG